VIYSALRKALSGGQVSVSVWTLGSFLRTSQPLITAMLSEFQCPCGLWGLFYQNLTDAGLNTVGDVFQCPCGLWGLFYEENCEESQVRSCVLFQCPCGLWGLFYRVST